jgi:hypothetical protein
MKCTYPAAFMLALTVVLLAGSAGSSQPKAGEQERTVSDLDGNDLLRLCTSELPVDVTFCMGYVEGVRDGLVWGTIERKPSFGIPAQVKSGQLKDVVVKYLKEHPENRHKEAGFLTIGALKDAFPPESPK